MLVDCTGQVRLVLYLQNVLDRDDQQPARCRGKKSDNREKVAILQTLLSERAAEREVRSAALLARLTRIHVQPEFHIEIMARSPAREGGEIVGVERGEGGLAILFRRLERAV